MPELPEVETVRRGIEPHVKGLKIKEIILRRANLRWQMPKNLNQTLTGQKLKDVERRGKYLLLHFSVGTLILHLGMSGRLRLVSHDTSIQKHDHIDIIFANNRILRFTDPRRFGALLFTAGDPLQHPLIKNMGPEPLTTMFSSNYLWKKAQGRKIAIKSLVMNSNIVAGVGNIYATESLFKAGIHPLMPAKDLTQTQAKKLVTAIKQVLKQAIRQGGTTLKDFMQSDGSPGYFAVRLQVYGRENQKCRRCATTLKLLRIGQRSTVFCPRCQK